MHIKHTKHSNFELLLLLTHCIPYSPVCFILQSVYLEYLGFSGDNRTVQS
jgi:hypothetical protein